MARSVLADEIKKRLPFESATEEAMLNVLRTQAALAEPMEKLFKEFGISPPKYNILRILRGAVATGETARHGLPSLEIAQRMITRVPDITRLVDGLEKENLVCRTRCVEDRRVVYVGITSKGLELLAKLDAPTTKINHDMLSHLSKEELAEFNRLLVKARRAGENEQ